MQTVTKTGMKPASKKHADNLFQTKMEESRRTGRQIDSMADRQTDSKQADRQPGKQADRQQTCRQTA